MVKISDIKSNEKLPKIQQPLLVVNTPQSQQPDLLLQNEGQQPQQHLQLLKQLMLLQRPQVPGQLIVFPLTQTPTQSQSNTLSEPDPKSQTQATPPPIVSNSEAQTPGCSAQTSLEPAANPQQSSPTQLEPNPEPEPQEKATPMLPQLSSEPQPQVQVVTEIEPQTQVFTEIEPQTQQIVLVEPEPQVQPQILIEVKHLSQQQQQQQQQQPVLAQESQCQTQNLIETEVPPQEPLLNESQKQSPPVVTITVPSLLEDMDCFFEPQPPQIIRPNSPLESQFSAYPESAPSDFINLDQISIDEHSELHYALEPPIDLEEQQDLFFENMQATNIDAAQMSIELLCNEPIGSAIRSIPEDLEEQYILQQYRELELDKELTVQNEEQITEFLISMNPSADSENIPNVQNGEGCDNVIAMDLENICNVLDNGSYQCKLCKTIRCQRRSIVQHIRNEHEVRCDICNERFGGIRDYKAHMSKHRKNAMNCVCDICDVEMTSKEHLEYHRQTKHSNVHSVQNHRERFDCDVCRKSFSLKSKLQQHLINHHSDQFNCKVCNVKCRSNRHLQAHYRKLHPTNGFGHRCNICQRIMATADSLRKHLATHKKTFKCPDCNKVMNTNYCLTKHREKMHHRKRQILFPCTECDKEFTEEITLKMHLLKHAGIKPYQCNVCGVRYSQRTPMMHHWKLHHSADDSKPPPKVLLQPLFKKAQERISERRNKSMKKS